MLKKNIVSLVLIACALFAGWFLYQAFEKNRLAHLAHPVLPDVLKRDFYSSKVQPIFANKCVACHSCYNSPCQLNLTSFSGVVRGASKINPYDFQLLSPQKPTRLDVDATKEKDWQKKSFFSVLSTTTHENASTNGSILWQLIHLTGEAPTSKRVYLAEESRTCPSTKEKELGKFMTEQSFARMPYGLPALTKEEKDTLKEWFDQGAPGPNEAAREFLTTAQTSRAKSEIEKWEELLNKKDFKSALSARYLFEHLLVAHISFEPRDQEYFRLVRATNRTGLADEIPTVFPFDDPGREFFYRFKKIDQVIVEKTHTIFDMGPSVRHWFRSEFIESSWAKTPTQLPTYGKAASNPFITFQAIPRQARYQFFLKNSRYFVMSFMKGPVCRGQTALNVINDHFWVMFIDPKHDLSAQNDPAVDEMEKLMAPPAGIENNIASILKFRNERWQANIQKAQIYVKKKKPYSLDMIWNGGKEHDANALLTVYRHFDSSDVLYGAFGEVPDTVWLFDYQIFENVYYNLVAAYNVFGTALHQLESRVYMENNRIASEDNFLTLLPQNKRSAIRNQWSHEAPKSKDKSLFTDIKKSLVSFATSEWKDNYPYSGQKIETTVKFVTQDTKKELFDRIFKERLSHQVRSRPDTINLPDAQKQVDIPAQHLSRAAEALKKIAGREGAFTVHFPDVVMLRVFADGKPDEIYSIVHNKAHANVMLLFFESLRREPQRDTLNVIPGYAASYPNLYLELHEDKIDDFVKDVTQIANAYPHIEDMAKLEDGKTLNTNFAPIAKKYGVSRFRSDFWKVHESFNANYRRIDPVEAGLLDLNRYSSY